MQWYNNQHRATRDANRLSLCLLGRVGQGGNSINGQTLLCNELLTLKQNTNIQSIFFRPFCRWGQTWHIIPTHRPLDGGGGSSVDANEGHGLDKCWFHNIFAIEWVEGLVSLSFAWCSLDRGVSSLNDSKDEDEVLLERYHHWRRRLLHDKRGNSCEGDRTSVTHFSRPIHRTIQMKSTLC